MAEISHCAGICHKRSSDPTLLRLRQHSCSLTNSECSSISSNNQSPVASGPAGASKVKLAAIGRQKRIELESNIEALSSTSNAKLKAFKSHHGEAQKFELCKNYLHLIKHDNLQGNKAVTVVDVHHQEKLYNDHEDDPYLICDLTSFMEQHPMKVRDRLAHFDYTSSEEDIAQKMQNMGLT